jgi:hypothetical protein
VRHLEDEGAGAAGLEDRSRQRRRAPTPLLDQGMGPQRAEVSVDGAPAGTWYDPDRNPWKRLAESDYELPPAFVKGKSSIRVTFRPAGATWSIGELRAFSHVDRPLGEATGKGR